MNCNSCGMANLELGDFCPKCDEELVEQFDGKLCYVDIAHQGEDWEMAKEKLEIAIDRAFFAQARGIKIIHGKGSREGHSNIIACKTTPYLKKLVKLYGGEVVNDRFNTGAHLIYFNK